MKKKITFEKKSKLVRGIALALAAVTVAGAVITPAMAMESDTIVSSDNWEYEIVSTDKNGNSLNVQYAKITKYTGHESDVVIPDSLGGYPVKNIGTDVFEGTSGIKTLTLGKNLSGGNDSVFDDLKDVTEYKVEDGNTRYVADNGVLYVKNGTSKKLFAYPKAKTGSYSIPIDTTGIGYRAFFETEIDTLNIPQGVTIDNEASGNKYIYSFLGAKVNKFNYDGDTSGAIIKDGRLIAYGLDSNVDLSSITSANPYAFQTVESLENATLPETVKATVPFTFYSGEIDGLPTRYFNLNGKTAYCYHYGARNPEIVGEANNYDKTIDSDEVRHNIKAVLFAGYPNDAYNLQKQYGISDEVARNITGSLVWEALDNSLSIPNSSIYKANDENSINYRNALEEKVKDVKDSEMKDFELKFFQPVIENTQGLIQIEKKSAPVEVSISISKKDLTTNDELPGAKLILKRDSETVKEWVSTDTPMSITGLNDGSYTLTEIQAPTGYEVAESITFTVVNGVPSKSDIVMYDKRTTATVSISKKDITNGEELPGAKLILKKGEDIIKEWISSDIPMEISELEDGVYTLTEIQAPDGYNIAESITFKIENGKASKSTIIMYDTQIKHATPSEPDKPASPSGPTKPGTPSDIEKPSTPSDLKPDNPTPDKPSNDTPSDNTNNRTHHHSSGGGTTTSKNTNSVASTPSSPVVADEPTILPALDRRPVKTGDRTTTLLFLTSIMTLIGLHIFKKKKQ